MSSVPGAARLQGGPAELPGPLAPHPCCSAWAGVGGGSPSPRPCPDSPVCFELHDAQASSGAGGGELPDSICWLLFYSWGALCVRKGWARVPQGLVWEGLELSWHMVGVGWGFLPCPASGGCILSFPAGLVYSALRSFGCLEFAQGGLPGQPAGWSRACLGFQG